MHTSANPSPHLVVLFGIVGKKYTGSLKSVWRLLGEGGGGGVLTLLAVSGNRLLT